MRDGEIKGKIVFVSSMLGLLSFVGYSTYSPSKFAVRGLADTLRNELKRYGIEVHVFFPGNIDSPGFVTEVVTKQCIDDITKTIGYLCVDHPSFLEHDETQSDERD